MKLSVTGVSMAVFAIISLLKLLGIEASEEVVSNVVQNVINVVTNVIQIISFVTMIYGQYRRKDVTKFVIKNVQN